MKKKGWFPKKKNIRLCLLLLKINDSTGHHIDSAISDNGKWFIEYLAFLYSIDFVYSSNCKWLIYYLSGDQ
jgi:hypothetical protein